MTLLLQYTLIFASVLLLVALGGTFFETVPTWYPIILTVITVAYLLFGSKIGNAQSNEARKMWEELILLVAGAGIIAVGADLLVENGTIGKIVEIESADGDNVEIVVE